MVYLGADHGGVHLKEKMKQWLQELRIEYEDLGASSIDPADDYPDFAHAVATKTVQNPEENKGILICRSGGGMAIAANRTPQARAVYVYDKRSAEHARVDNDANIAAFAADWIDESTAKESLVTFLDTPFSQKERHIRRIGKLELL